MNENEEEKNNILREEQIKEFLFCKYEIKINTVDETCRQDELEDYCDKKIADVLPMSSVSFPAITKIHTTGSRAEKLWIDKSDKDIIYEIGPGLIYQKKMESQKDDLHHQRYPLDVGFFWEDAEQNIGYYRVFDSKGGYLYPQDLQMKLAPTFQYLDMDAPINNRQSSSQNVAKKRKMTQAAVNLNNGHDHVIGLKLDKWPDSIKNKFTPKLKLTPSEIQQILGKG